MRLVIPLRTLWCVFNDAKCELECYFDEKAFLQEIEHRKKLNLKRGATKSSSQILFRINISKSVIIASYLNDSNQFKIR